MLKINNKIVNNYQKGVEFHDPKNLIHSSLRTVINQRIQTFNSEKMESIIVNPITHWAFYIVDGYSEKFKTYLEDQLKYGEQNSRTLIVINGPLDKSVINYLLLPINGIVSLSYLSNEYNVVLDSLWNNSMFLQQGLHKNLSQELDFKKTYSTPIKKFVLNKNKITVDLSDRDYQVLQLLLDGHSNSEIAEKMHFARSTVSTIISSLLRKMKASDRTDATVKTIRNGWVDCYR